MAGDGNNAITLTGSGSDIVVAGNDNKSIQTGSGNDNISMGNGNNYVTGDAAYNTCTYGTGHDTKVNCQMRVRDVGFEPQFTSKTSQLQKPKRLPFKPNKR